MNAMAGVELKRSGNESGDGWGSLVGVDLGVGQACVVIDDRVAELPADAFAPLLAGAVRSPVTLCPGRENLARRLVSICNRSPGQGHSPPDLLALSGGHPGEASPFNTSRRSREPSRARRRSASAPNPCVPWPHRHGHASVRWRATAGGEASRAAHQPKPPKHARPLRRGGNARPRTGCRDAHPPPRSRFVPREPSPRQSSTSSIRCQRGSHLRLFCIRAVTSECRDLWKDHNSRTQPGCYLPVRKDPRHVI